MKKVNRRDMRAIQKKALKEVKHSKITPPTKKTLKPLSTENGLILYLNTSLERLVKKPKKKK